MNDVEKTRKRALAEIFWQLQELNDKEYTEIDFLLDGLARRLFRLQPKSLGKPPYKDWIYDV